MIVIFIRTVIIFITLMVIMRLMGKRQIGEMQAFELVITLIIADLACIPMSDVSIPLIYGIVSISALFILHQLMSLLEKCGDGIKRVINGKPSIVLDKKGVDFKELKKNNLSVEDLIEAMRSLGYFSLCELDYAIFESNGKLSALPKLDYDKKERSIPVLIIDEGKVNNGNLEKAKISKEYLKTLLNEKNLTEKTVGVMTVDGNGKVYLQGYKKHYEIFYIKADKKW